MPACHSKFFCLGWFFLLTPFPSGAGQVLGDDIQRRGFTHCYHCGACNGVNRDPGYPGKPKRTMPGDLNRGDCPPKRYLMNDWERAGKPHCVAPWAGRGISDKYSAWFVGGGEAFAKLPHHGRPRKANGRNQFGEGTWGLDYNGFFGKANVWLLYTRGRYQGGEGAYATDGEPELVARLKSLLHHK